MVEVMLKIVSDAPEAGIHYWHFEEGDYVEKGEDLVEIICEGTHYQLIAPATGTLSRVYYDVGEMVTIGEVIAEIDDSEF